MRRHESRVRGYCRMMLSDAGLAEDAAQEVFIKAYQGLSRFRGKAAFSTWLYRISANHCSDLLRKKTWRKTESWEALLEKEGAKVEALFSSPPDAWNFEQSELLAKFLAFLPEKARAVLLMKEIQGMSYLEISEAMECTVDAVKGQLKRTRQEIEARAKKFFRSEKVSNAGEQA